jgi:PTS system N-acetylglucosamine-specific IIC component
MKINFEKLQQLGRTLMLPIALLPIAGILLRLGQPDLLNLKYVASAGQVIFTNLPLLFALGVACGFAKDNNGTAVLASCVGYFIMTSVLENMDKTLNTGVLGGIIIGVISAKLYNKYYDIKLPEYLAFFGGKRFVPIITGITAVLLGLLLGIVWPKIQIIINYLGTWLIDSGNIGLFIYGVVNRILIITGLHHVLNNLVWFIFGNYTNIDHIVSHGDIARFVAGDKTAGTFMSGFFPIMMGGLPAVCLAIYKNALPYNKKLVGGLLLSMAVTSFLTGVTEPIEFSFLFLAPVLFAIHAVLTGLSFVIVNYLGIHLGFTFSAGMIDYILFFKLATKPLLALPIMLFMFIVYFIIFDFFIKKLNLQTIGREVSSNDKVDSPIAQSEDDKIISYVLALGGVDNLVDISACTTRLRLKVKDISVIKQEILKKLGAKGIITPTNDTVQVIIGPTADILCEKIKKSLSFIKNSAINVVKPTGIVKEFDSKISADLCHDYASQIVNHLGGGDNILSIQLIAYTRFKIQVKEQDLIDEIWLKDLEKKYLSIDDNIKHIYIGNDAPILFEAINKIIKHIN